MAQASDADAVTRLVLGWLAAKRSKHTRAAYARDIGITPQRRASRAPSWLAWCRAEGIHPVTGVTGLHVAVYTRQLETAGLSAASVARKLAAVSGWYAWLARRGHISASPAADIPRPRASTEPASAPGLTRQQALTLLRAADTAPGRQRARTAALVAVLLFTGARVSEVTAADIEDVGLIQGRRVLWVTRRDGRRHPLLLPAPAAARLDAYLAGRIRRPGRMPAARAGRTLAPGTRPGTGQGRRVLFATRTGSRLFTADVWQTLRRLATRADLPPDLIARFGPQLLRRSFAALYLDAGGSLGELQTALGHADPRTTRRYARPAPGQVVAAYLADPAPEARR